MNEADKKTCKVCAEGGKELWRCILLQGHEDCEANPWTRIKNHYLKSDKQMYVPTPTNVVEHKTPLDLPLKKFNIDRNQRGVLSSSSTRRKITK